VKSGITAFLLVFRAFRRHLQPQAAARAHPHRVTGPQRHRGDRRPALAAQQHHALAPGPGEHAAARADHPGVAGDHRPPARAPDRGRRRPEQQRAEPGGGDRQRRGQREARRADVEGDGGAERQRDHAAGAQHAEGGQERLHGQQRGAEAHERQPGEVDRQQVEGEQPEQQRDAPATPPAPKPGVASSKARP
jgi:hypothetical protein